MSGGRTGTGCRSMEKEASLVSLLPDVLSMLTEKISI